MLVETFVEIDDSQVLDSFRCGGNAELFSYDFVSDEPGALVAALMHWFWKESSFFRLLPMKCDQVGQA